VAGKSLGMWSLRHVLDDPVNRKVSEDHAPDHHDPDGGFRNPWPHAEPASFGAAVKWMLSRHRPHDESMSGVVRPAAKSPHADGAELAITWVGHSTFLIQSGGISVLTDPIWSMRASPLQFVGPRRHTPSGIAFDKLPSIDAVFISHDHYDHLDDRTVRRIIKRWPDASWITPLGVGAFITRRGAARVTEMDWWEERLIGQISVHCTPAMHFSGRYPWNRNATLWSGWVIALGSHRVFFAGDTGLHPEFADISRRLGPFDAAILPIGAYEPRWFMRTVHMSPEDSVAAYCEIAAATPEDECAFVPCHWGTFRLTDEPLDEPPRRLRKAWSEAGLDEQRLWMLRHGETKRQP
jgi:N-acyl-phosphatidylethanolamine-hydrolysing phospholipase D